MIIKIIIIIITLLREEFLNYETQRNPVVSSFILCWFLVSFVPLSVHSFASTVDFFSYPDLILSFAVLGRRRSGYEINNSQQNILTY